MNLNIPGVEIMKAIPIEIISKPFQIVFLSLVVISAVLLVIGMIGNIKKLLILGCIGYILCGASGVLTKITSIGKVPTGEYQYTVSFDEGIALDEVLQHFDIVGKSGDQYIIQARPSGE